MTRRDEGGFTLIETIIAVTLFAMLTGAFYTVMFSGVRSADDSRSVTRMSEEARLGFNRMIRDTREAADLSACTPSNFSICYRVRVDFNNDGLYQNPNTSGDYEDLTYAFNAIDKEITLNGETLIAGVRTVPGKNVFTYTSNALEYDADQNGVTTSTELDQSGIATVGNGNGVLDNPELNFITSVAYAFRVEHGKRLCNGTGTGDDPCETFYAEAQLRNRR